MRTFAIPIGNNTDKPAEIAQLVEHNLAKVGVASSSLVFRSKRVSRNADLNFASRQSVAEPAEITRRGTIICRSSFTKVGFFFFTRNAVLPDTKRLNVKSGIMDIFGW